MNKKKNITKAMVNPKLLLLHNKKADPRNNSLNPLHN